MKRKLEDYTEAEFLKLLKGIYQVRTNSEHQHGRWVNRFNKITEHPKGHHLIYWPEEGADNSPKAVIAEIKAWRLAHGKPGFKPG